jgi:peroxidase
VSAPEEHATLFLACDVRANENSALTSMHTLWAREHNLIADQLADDNPELTDEQLYQQAREIVIAEVQTITYSEYLPALMGKNALSDYSGYDSSIDPSIANEFSTAAYRFGHTMLPNGFLRLNNDGTESDAGNLELKNAFFNSQNIQDYGIDSLLKGVTSQDANEVDTLVVDGVRNFLFGNPGVGGFDLAALNIQRGRDHGLADYNQTRIDIGLDPVYDFDDITSDVDLQDKLRDLYGTVNNIDLWVGGLAEDHIDGSSLSETFQAILVDQFTKLRDGDRFWYENILDSDMVEEIESTTLADVIERNTNLDSLQDNVFFIA